MDENELIEINNTNGLQKYSDISEELVWFKNINSSCTRKTYEDSLVSFSKFLGIRNIEELKQIQSIHVIEYREFLKKSGFKKSTINTRLASLSSLFKHLVEKQIVKINPANGVQRMKKDYKKVTSRALVDNEVSAILNQPNLETLIGLRDKAILSIMFNIGPRVSSVVNLKGRDIYEENGYLLFDLLLKGDKRAIVAVNSHIQASLRNYFEAMGWYKINDEGKSGFNIPSHLPLFPSMSNNTKVHGFTKPISRVYLYKMWKKYASEAKVERTRPHCARSTFITSAFKAGGDPIHIQNTVGHSDIRTTVSYNHNETAHKDSASFKVSFG